MSFYEEFGKRVLEEMKSWDFYRLDYNAAANKDIISLLHEKGALSDKVIDESLKEMVIKKARKDYEMVLKGRTYPDHLGNPECLAYAISNGVFSPGEVQKIQFDHGENFSSFCRYYGKDNLLERLKSQFLNPQMDVAETGVRVFPLLKEVKD